MALFGADLIDMVNTLQNKLAASGKLLDVSLPQIVVVGGQSAGKSSVLENIIGREFLPRGTDTVTRRPTIIQLQPHEKVYAEFLHLPNVRFTDFEEVKKEIVQETFRDPGPSGFSILPISLKIYAPDVLKLTFIDLPGMIKISVGDELEDSIEDVRNMILFYIKQPNSLILAVSPANQDIALSDALEIAKIADPNRERTIGVLTKLDLMDAGTHACAVLENKTLTLKRGYVGVVSRSQQDIIDGRDIQYALVQEERFFKNHPAYMRIADKMGSVYLQELLHVELREHIKQTLPTLARQLKDNLNGLRRDLRIYDEMFCFDSEDGGDIQAFMFQMVQRFIDSIRAKLFGHSEELGMENLSAGAVINYKLYTEMKSILKLPNKLTDEEITIIIANQHGIRNIVSVPAIALESACGSILKDYKEPLEKFVDSIAELLLSTVDDSSTLIDACPILKGQIVHFINENIDRCSDLTKDMLNKHLKAQMTCCNIYHENLSSEGLENGLFGNPVKVWADEESEDCTVTDDLTTAGRKISEKMMENDNAKQNSQYLASIVREYMDVIQKQISDITIKYIICFLVKEVANFIRSKLILKLMTSPILDKVKEDCKKCYNQRAEIQGMCNAFEEALSCVRMFSR